VIAIYRKFLYLKAISPGPVTPSKTVDTVWHLHLEFAEDYEALCRATGRELRHDKSLNPSVLDKAYLDGKALYEAEFDAPADPDLWPSPTNDANESVNRILFLIVFLLLFVCFCVALALGSRNSWMAFGIAVCFGFGILAWADRRWPHQRGPEERARCG
jgi:hypothetical protein